MSDFYTLRATTIARIARDQLMLDALEIRGVDLLDFHQCFVGAIRQALEDAWDTGLRTGRGGS